MTFRIENHQRYTRTVYGITRQPSKYVFCRVKNLFIHVFIQTNPNSIHQNSCNTQLFLQAINFPNSFQATTPNVTINPFFRPLQRHQPSHTLKRCQHSHIFDFLLYLGRRSIQLLSNRSLLIHW